MKKILAVVSIVAMVGCASAPVQRGNWVSIAEQYNLTQKHLQSTLVSRQSIEMQGIMWLGWQEYLW